MKKRKNKGFFISFMVLLTYLIGNIFLIFASLYHFFSQDSDHKKKK